uniref:Acetyl-CoA carboxylase n=1 Tax=Oxyrrhis marina TaxID=2969 RepID=A0A7S4GNE6_OXYMA
MSTQIVSLEEFVKQHGGKRAIRRILLANNGMAATKAIMSMRQWAFLTLGSAKDLEFIVMASKDDLEANAEFIRLADAFVEVPAGKNSNNYANVPLICEIAKKQNVDAVWPGWGHASENPALPRTLSEMGITFIGPTAPVMHALGDKIASTILAQAAGVPCIPWNGDGIACELLPDGTLPEDVFKSACLQSLDEAIACANRIGYPVMLKASEGGGGKGIRKCATEAELRSAYDQVKMEVVGSPIFMMALCTGARHLEVQLVGDEHGDVVALNGRDCSTQRRFQKIFEEGPPIIAPEETFRKMEQAAMRLAKSVGYRGAGTVEYLFSASTGEYSFLELNPRLQVEHPVTEGITGVNVPALQLLVAMGIPLSRVPDVRRFYGLDPAGDSAIDFLETRYPRPTCHVLAARITAENPDDAFRPTSGAVDRVRFQSAPNCWGYFSIGANGKIHEFADSQFGHLFAKGETREQARKNLQLALKNLIIDGDIRTPVEYLVELAETPEFKENTIDTAWLDRLIADKAVQTKLNALDAVFYAACFRAFSMVKDRTAVILDGIERGHLPLSNDLSLLRSFNVEVAFAQTKYVWKIYRTGADAFTLEINGVSLDAKIREQPDGSLYVQAGKRVAQVQGQEEALGLRLRIDGSSTVTFPTLRDPSELRSEFNGKFVRFLHADGAEIEKGEPYAELEAMKMIMSLRATESGVIHQAVTPGAIVAPGQLLANLDLKDPSQVELVKAFEGEFELSGSEATRETKRFASNAGASTVLDLGLDDIEKCLCNTVRGFAIAGEFFNSPATASATKLVQLLFPGGDYELDFQRYHTVCAKVIESFLQTEKFFAGLVGGDETQIIAKFPGSPRELLEALMAHDALKDSRPVVASILRALVSEGDMAVHTGHEIGPDLKEGLEELVTLPQEGGYGELALLASSVLQQAQAKPFFEQREEVRRILVNTSRGRLGELAPVDAVAGQGVDLISSFFGDKDTAVRAKAAEVFIRRLHRSYSVSEFDSVEGGPSDTLQLTWKLGFPGVGKANLDAHCIVVQNVDSMESLASGWKLPSSQLQEVNIFVADVPVPVMKDKAMHKAAFASLVEKCSKLVAGITAQLREKQCPLVHFVLCRDGASPFYLHYRDDGSSFQELSQYRLLRSSHLHTMDLQTVEKEFSLAEASVSDRRFAVFLGKAHASASASMLLVRALYRRQVNLSDVEEAMSNQLLESFDRIERAQLDPVVEKIQPTARIFLHFQSPIPGCTDRDLKLLKSIFNRAMQRRVTAYGARLLKLRIEVVEIKVWAGASSPPIALRLIAKATDGWDGDALLEKVDADSGKITSWVDIDTNEERTDLYTTTPLEMKMHAKRAAARRANTTYIYDFPRLFRAALTQRWLVERPNEPVPEKIFMSKELRMQDGHLVETSRGLGENTVGMVVWVCMMKTPEYPDGREVVLIGNDITVKAGSFGTAEDDKFNLASQLARQRGVPRVYIAANSGARLGTVEELKSMVQVAWVDKNDPNKGFDYLFLTESDFHSLPGKSVKSHTVTVNGEVRHVLDSIVGLNLKSTEGGIGVENLQGSGMIAGETARAYNEVFTLSYATGRSVGIGAYLNRLGQRNIQMVKGPMILTGYHALNKLLGAQVYTTQDQLGGPHIMVPNGVTHELVQNDQAGVDAILRWLAFVPKTVASLPPMLPVRDPIDREIGFMPSKEPYDPRHMLAGVKADGQYLSGFCDEGSFHEYMSGWGKTVVVGRGRLGGIPIGVIAVETRSVERHIPADPANPKSQNIVEAQAGQVWFPDSAFKTAQAIKDFNRGENLPLVIFANWRGFSGGTRDMFAEVLKYGAMIVDALVEYKHPIFIYIPPHGELRGGAWVVVDPKINPDQMEMYADEEARGGILEAAAAAEIVFKEKTIFEMMHRTDEKLQSLDARKSAGEGVDAEIQAREKLLLPLYRQVATMYCDLHDRAGRMEEIGAIRAGLRWRQARSYMHWRIRRRVQEDGIIKSARASVPDLDHAGARAFVNELLTNATVDPSSDRAVAEWIERTRDEIGFRIEERRQKQVESQLFALFNTLPNSKRQDVVRDLVGYCKVSVTEQGSQSKVKLSGW